MTYNISNYKEKKKKNNGFPVHRTGLRLVIVIIEVAELISFTLKFEAEALSATKQKSLHGDSRRISDATTPQHKNHHTQLIRFLQHVCVPLHSPKSQTVLSSNT